MREGLRIYNLFPTLAGPIAGWTAQLPRIAAMGFNAVYINPFHDTGFSGSLYAVRTITGEPALPRQGQGRTTRYARL
jgi:starch synthase (maltosyl-transferring)